MAEGVSKSDLVSGNAIEEIKADIDQLAMSLEKMDDGFRGIAKTLKSEINPVLDKTTKGLRATNEQDIKSEKLIREKLINEEKLKKVKIAQERLDQAELRTKVANNRETERQENLKKRELAAKEKANKAAERAKKLIQDEANAYKKLTRATNDAQAELKRLSAQYGVGSKQARKAKIKFDALDKSLRRINKEARDGRRDVGRYGLAWTKAQSALGAVGVSVGVGFAVREGINILTDFDEAAADMAKTLNITKEAARELSMELINIDTRTSIDDLQKIATIGGQMGIASNEITAFTKSIDVLNVSLGDEFTGGAEEITKEIGGLRNVLTDTKTGDISKDLLKIGNALNVLGASGNATSPVITDFSKRISGVGIPLGLTTSQILGTSAALQELGVRSEKGGTAVGKILQKMTTDVEGFAELAGKPVDEFTNMINNDLFGAFQAVLKGTNKFKGDSVGLGKQLKSLGLTGSGTSEVFLKLGGNIDLMTEKVNLSAEALTNTDSVTNEFNTKNETLGATISKATKKIKEQIISFDKATGFSKKLAAAISFLADNFGTILSVGGKLLKFLLIYKARLIVLNALNGKFGDSLKGLVSGFKNLVTGGKRSIVTLKNVGKSLLKSKLAMVGAIAAAIELAKAFYDVASGARQARFDAEQLEIALGKVNKFVEDDISNRQLQLDRALELAKTDAERLKLQQEFNAMNHVRRDQLNEELEIEKEKLALITKAKKAADSPTGSTGFNAYLKNITESADQFADFFTDFDDLDDLYAKQLAEVKALEAGVKTYNSAIGETSHQLEVVKANITASTEGLEDNTSATNSNTKSKEKQLKAIKDIDEVLAARNVTALEELNLAKEDEISQENEAIQKLLTQRLTFINDAERAEKITAKEAAEQRIIAELESLNARKKILIAYGRDVIDIDKEISDKRLELVKSNSEIEIDIETDKNEEIFNAYKNLQEALTDVLTSQIDERIALLGKESDAAKSQQDYFEALAANGNITAEQSITKMIEIQREAEAEQARLAKVKQNIEMISAGLKTYTAAIESGDTPAQALASTLTTTQVLASILGNLNFFAKGTDNASKGWSVVDEEGPEIVTDKKGNIKDFGSSGGARFKYLEQGDKVITARKSANLLSKFDQIGMRDTVSKASDVAGNSYDMAIINKSIQDMRGDMSKLQTQINVDWQSLADGMARVNVHTSRGGDKRTERYNIR